MLLLYHIISYYLLRGAAAVRPGPPLFGPPDLYIMSIRITMVIGMMMMIVKHMCIYIYIYIYTERDACMHACMYACMCILCVCMCICVCIYVCMYVCMYVCVYIYIYIYICIKGLCMRPLFLAYSMLKNILACAEIHV